MDSQRRKMITNGGFPWRCFIVLRKLTAKRKILGVSRSALEKLPSGSRKNTKWELNLLLPQQLFFQMPQKIPVGNLIQKHRRWCKIAFGVLNVGRFKLGASVTGGAKLACPRSGSLCRMSVISSTNRFLRLVQSSLRLAEMAGLKRVSSAITTAQSG